MDQKLGGWGPAICVLTDALQTRMHAQVGTSVPEHLPPPPSAQLTPTHLQHSLLQAVLRDYLPQPFLFPPPGSLSLLLLLVSRGKFPEDKTCS